MAPHPDIADWLEALEERHLAELSFAEVRRSIQVLSQRYVHDKREDGPIRALDGRGKRAAFALFYAPLHLLTANRIATELGTGCRGTLLDLGCGTGASAAGWALAGNPPRPHLSGLDRSGWALTEARWNWKRLGLRGECGRGDLTQGLPAGRADAIVLGWTVNELDRPAREALLERLLGQARRGVEVLVIEPIARRVTPWWDEWTTRFAEIGGRNDDWKFDGALPARLREFDRAAGLDHRELTARSLWVRAARTTPRRPV